MKYWYVCLCMLIMRAYSQQSVMPLVSRQGTSIATRFIVPKDYVRQVYSNGSFGAYLQQLALKPVGSEVLFFNGVAKPNQDMVAAVLAIDVGKKDLQQCADAIMRLRAEYLYGQKKYADIHFKFTNGFNAEYLKWAEGGRILVKGNVCIWHKTGAKDYSYGSFRKYLDMVFCYAGTLSLSKELKSVAIQNIAVGDVFIKGGSPGHAVIVVDVAIHKNTGKRIFLLAQSYMPAQNIHVLVNETNADLSPWYEAIESGQLYTPEWIFDRTMLKRFE